MKRTYVFLMMFVLLLLVGCARTAPYEVKHNSHTYVIDPTEGTITKNGVTSHYEVTIRRGVETRLVLSRSDGEWVAMVNTVHGPDRREHSDGYPKPTYSYITEVWEVLELEGAERPNAQVELYSGLAFLLLGLFCVLWPDKVPFTGNPENEGEPTPTALRACRITGVVCIAAALVLAGLYAVRIALEFYKYSVYFV